MKDISFISDWFMLLTPCIFMLLDLVTGLAKAWSTKSFKSTKMRSGLSKKVGELSMIIGGEVLSIALNLPKYIETFICLYIILMEVMSIFENLDELGVKIPTFIKDVVNNTADKIDKGDE